MRPCLEKAHHKKRLVEWLKVKALSSNPSKEGREGRKKEGKREGGREGRRKGGSQAPLA
jgi:hypothetical protein